MHEKPVLFPLDICIQCVEDTGGLDSTIGEYLVRVRVSSLGPWDSIEELQDELGRIKKGKDTLERHFRDDVSEKSRGFYLEMNAEEPFFHYELLFNEVYPSDVVKRVKELISLTEV